MSSRTAFQFATAGQIVFGPGTFQEIGQMVAKLGRKAFVTTSLHAQFLDRLTVLLAEQNITVERFLVNGEPSIPMILEGLQAARKTECDCVIGLGGGSALDAGKAIAALLTNPGRPLDYLEVVGRGQPLEVQPAPFIAVPTTAGTGSEVTRNAVLFVPEQQVKVSLRSEMMLPRFALVDPELTYNLPPDVTAATGMDALAQVIEPFVSRRANAFSDLFCQEGITRAARALPRAYRDGQDKVAREDMSFAALMGGLALANAGLGAVHGFAGPIGGMFDAPHGAVCAALLPSTVRVNAKALQARQPENPALHRYLEIAWMVTGNAGASIADLVAWLEALREHLQIPGLNAYGISSGDLNVLVQSGAAASSMKANPLTLTEDEMHKILEMAL